MDLRSSFLLFIFHTGGSGFAITAAAQRPNKGAKYRCCFPGCNYTAPAFSPWLRKHFKEHPPSSVHGHRRVEIDDFSFFDDWDHGVWQITSPEEARQDAPIPSNLAENPPTINQPLGVENLYPVIPEPPAPEETAEGADVAMEVEDLNLAAIEVPSASDTIQTAALAECNFKINVLSNTETKVLICLQCQSAVNPTAIASHILKYKENHSQRKQLSASTKTWIKGFEGNQAHGFASSAEDIPNQTNGTSWPPVTGLAINNKGYQCQDCWKCYSKQGAADRCRRNAPEKHAQYSSIKSGVSVQKIFRKYVAVDIHLFNATPATRLYIEQGYSAQIEAISSSAAAIEPTENTPWIQETGWLVILKPFDVAKLMPLVHPPFKSKNPLGLPLQNIVCSYMTLVSKIAVHPHRAIFTMRQYLHSSPVYVYLFWYRLSLTFYAFFSNANTPAWRVLKPQSLKQYAITLYKIIHAILLLSQGRDSAICHSFNTALT